MSYYSTMAHIDNLLWEISLLPTTIDAWYKSKKALEDPTYFQDHPCSKEEKKKDETVKKEAEKEFKKDQDSSLTKSMIAVIDREAGADPIKAVKLTTKALATSKLIQFAFFYMTDSRAELIKIPQVEREIVNGIAERLEFGRIYMSAGVNNLKAYDPEYENDYLESSKFLLSIKDIDNKRSDSIFMEKLQKRKEEVALMYEHPEDDTPETKEPEQVKWNIDADGIVYPVFGTAVKDIENTPISDPQAPQVNGITKEAFDKLEAYFSPITTNCINRRYDLYGDTGLLRMYLMRPNGFEETYVIDPGIVMGKDTVYLLANMGNDDTIFVSVTEQPEICKNILSTIFYVLTQDEIQIVFNDYFRNINIYRYLDMSNTSFLKGMSSDKFQLLGKKMTFILNQLVTQNQNNIDLPRFRFLKFESVDDFSIISDNMVRSPLNFDGSTSNIICEGLQFTVKGDNVLETYLGESKEYHIDKYGDM